MRVDVMTAAERYGCNYETLRRFFKRGGIDGRYERTIGRNGSVQRRLTFDEDELAAASDGPLAHLVNRAVDTTTFDALLGSMSSEERTRYESRLDVEQAAKRHRCSQARIRRNFQAGALRGDYTLDRSRDGRVVKKLTFDPADLDACFEAEVTAEDRHRRHVAAIRAAAQPFSDRQKQVIASTFSDHLREKRDEVEAEATRVEEASEEDAAGMLQLAQTG